MLIANKISKLDHIVLHLGMECTTVRLTLCYPRNYNYSLYLQTSLVGLPLFSSFFYHHHFKTESTNEIEAALKTLPEFDGAYYCIDFSLAVQCVHFIVRF